MGRKKDSQCADEIIQKVASGSAWRYILLELFNIAPHKYCESFQCRFNEPTHPLAKKLKITGEELSLGISFLRDNCLIEDSSSKEPTPLKTITKDWSNCLLITKKGFDVALDLQKNIQENEFKNASVVFSAMIVFTSFFSILISVTRDELTNILLFIYAGVVLLIGILPYLVKKFKTKR